MPRTISQRFLQVDVDLRNDPDFIHYAHAVKEALPPTIGAYAKRIAYELLTGIWGGFLERIPSGRLRDVADSLDRSYVVIESWVGWDGCPGALGKAFSLHLCEPTDDGDMVIRGWDDRYGRLAQKRQVEATKKQKQRAKGDRTEECPHEKGTYATMSQRQTHEPETQHEDSKGTERESVPDKRGQVVEMSPEKRDNTAEMCPENGTKDDKSLRGLEALTPLPPPGGGGASPFPPPPPNSDAQPDAAPNLQPTATAAESAVPIGALTPAQRSVVERQGITDPEMLRRQAEFTAKLDAAVADVAHKGAKAAMRRVLEETQFAVDRWPDVVRRWIGWTDGLGTTGMRPLPWEAIDEGFHELLDNNAPGQRITSQVLLSFAEKAARRRASGDPPSDGSHAAAATGPLPPDMTAAAVAEARRYAERGHADWMAFCDEKGITFTPPAQEAVR